MYSVNGNSFLGLDVLRTRYCAVFPLIVTVLDSLIFTPVATPVADFSNSVMVLTRDAASPACSSTDQSPPE
ncbi:hypothetical protein D3C80_1847300 [compost metagenome]